MARPKTHYLPYHKAQEFARELHLTSRKQYWQWWDANKPAYIPKRPEKVYEQWESWNMFLGTTNTFDKERGTKIKKVYRPFWEAVRYAQQKAKEHNISTQGEWHEWHDSGMCAHDVPKRPDQVYEEFVGSGWKVWLGKNIESKIKTAEQNVGVMALCACPGEPANVIMRVVSGNGMAVLKEKYDDGVIGKPYRMYVWEKEMIPQVDALFARHCHKRDENVFVVPNMNALLFDLDAVLQWVRN